MTSSTNSMNAFDQEYGADYYQSQLGPEPYGRDNVALVSFFSTVADQLIRSERPRTVLDAGCAMGLLVEAFWDRGVRAFGVDVSSYAIARVRRDIQPYCKVASLADPIEGRYDLITCIEVLEHMPETEAIAAISNIAGATDTILFSSSFTDFDEPTHVNVRQPIWWLEEFGKVGFSPDLIYDASFVSPQAILLRKSAAPLPREVLRLFSELLRYKYAVSSRDEQIRKQSEQIKTMEYSATEERVSAHDQLKPLEEVIERQQQQLDVQQRQLEMLGREAAESRNRLDRVQRELDSSMAGNNAVLSEISDLRKQLTWVLRATEDGAAASERYSDQLAKHAEALRTEISPLRSVLLRHSERMEELERSAAQTTTQVREVLQSRIWQTLVRAGGVLLKLSGK